MSNSFFTVAEAIEDDDEDILIRLPDEFGIQEGEQFAISRRPDGVIILKPTK